jgi:heme-degrading monooxygenase HmoA
MIRVMIERQCKPGQEERLEGLLMEVRMEAMLRPGYVSSETLKALDNPSIYLVISTWSNETSRKAWENSQERWEMKQIIESILVAPEKVTYYQIVSQVGVE